MSLSFWHRAQAQNPNLEPYEIAHHKAQARLLADPDGFHEPDNGDIVRTLADAAEALDDDDVRVLSDSDLVDLLTKVDTALYQIVSVAVERQRHSGPTCQGRHRPVPDRSGKSANPYLLPDTGYRVDRLPPFGAGLYCPKASASAEGEEMSAAIEARDARAHSTGKAFAAALCAGQHALYALEALLEHPDGLPAYERMYLAAIAARLRAKLAEAERLEKPE